MKFKPIVLSVILITFSLTQGSCGGGGTPSVQTETGEVLKALTENVILPSLEKLLQNGRQLSEGLNGFCEDRQSGNLAAAQEMWRTTQAQLKRSELFGFGPYKMLDIQSKVDFWPTRPENIEAALQSETDFSADSLALQGVTLRGMPAIEYLLFGDEGSDDALQTFLDGGAGDLRCKLLTAQGEDLVRSLENYLQAWSPAGGGYGAEFYLAGRGSAEFAQTQDAINTFLNHLITSLEILKDDKLGKPLGKSSGGEPFPELVESPYAENSLANLHANIEGLRNLWFGEFEGRSGLGLFDLVQSKNPIVAEGVDTLIERALTGVDDIPESLSSSIVAESSTLEGAYQNLRDLRDVFSSSISAILGVNPFFSSTDGD